MAKSLASTGLAAGSPYALLKFIPRESEMQRIRDDGLCDEMETGTKNEVFQDNVNTETVNGEQEDMPMGNGNGKDLSSDEADNITAEHLHNPPEEATAEHLHNPSEEANKATAEDLNG